MRWRMLRSPTVSGQTSLSRWLHREMPRRGYPLEGHRAGGITRLAADTGISQATMSRMVSGLTEPSVDSLRKIGAVWDYTLQEMMVFAGLSEADGSHPVAHVSQVQVEAPEPTPGVRVERYDERHLRADVIVDIDVTMDEAIKSLGDLSDNERATVAMLRGMEYEPAEVAGAILLLRGLDAKRASQRGSGRRTS
jgi:transcriptional regulator with XRE-family HTH domain